MIQRADLTVMCAGNPLSVINALSMSHRRVTC